MTTGIRRVMRWALCGAAFAAVVASTGCGFTHRTPDAAERATAMHESRPTSLAPTTQRTARRPIFDNRNFIGVDDPTASVTRIPVINVFGELDGSAPGGQHQAAESGFQQHTFVEEGYDGDVAVSPDGRWLAYSSTRHNERPDIYLQRVDGLSVTQLTSDETDDAYPTFSPDGRQIAFCSTRAGSWDIYVMDADGGNATQITSGPSQDLHPSFSPDGKRLVYCSCGPRGGNWEIWTVDIATGARKIIGQGLFPTWSPDKHHDRIAFQRARQRGTRWFSLWTLDLVDGEARHVTEVAVSNNAAVICPTWSPDGQRLAFSTVVDPGRSGASGRAGGQQDVWVINVDGSNRQRLTDGSGVNVAPYWSSDGKVYFVSDRGGTECVWSANAPTPGAQRVLATDDKTKANTAGAVGATDGREVEH
jgi:TolB protein